MKNMMLLRFIELENEEFDLCFRRYLSELRFLKINK